MQLATIRDQQIVLVPETLEKVRSFPSGTMWVVVFGVGRSGKSFLCNMFASMYPPSSLTTSCLPPLPSHPHPPFFSPLEKVRHFPSGTMWVVEFGVAQASLSFATCLPSSPSPLEAVNQLMEIVVTLILPIFYIFFRSLFM